MLISADVTAMSETSGLRVLQTYAKAAEPCPACRLVRVCCTGRRTGTPDLLRTVVSGRVDDRLAVGERRIAQQFAPRLWFNFNAKEAVSLGAYQ